MRVAKLFPDAILPTRKHPMDAGVDLYAYIPEKDTQFSILSGGSAVIRTGITVSIPLGMAGYIWPKSRNDHLIGGGVVDQEYTGEILVKIINTSKFPMYVNHGDAIAQLVLCHTYSSSVEEVAIDQVHPNVTTRGATGGIVTQVKN